MDIELRFLNEPSPKGRKAEMRLKLLLLTLHWLFFWALSSLAQSWIDQHCNLQNNHHYLCPDIEYKKRDQQSLKMDVYLPKKLSNKTRSILVLHGGCFYMGDKSDDKGEALYFVNSGFAAIVVNYTLANNKPYPAAFEDVKDALLYIKKTITNELKIDNQWIAAFGESAGASLAGYLGTRADAGQNLAYANVVIDFFGRTDFTRPGSLEGPDDCPSIFAGKQNSATKAKEPNIDRTKYAVMNVKPVQGIKPANFFIAHSKDDETVESIHSEILKTDLKNAGLKEEVDFKVRIVPGALHGFTESQGPRIWRQAIEFLKSH